jgi:hypothetical protein
MCHFPLSMSALLGFDIDGETCIDGIDNAIGNCLVG